uniref:Uncharacterized protein n=1 Tax=Rhizophora mucronata TaxID=61149 RepID=A0A2P2R2U9_RHIMU
MVFYCLAPLSGVCKFVSSCMGQKLSTSNQMMIPRSLPTVNTLYTRVHQSCIHFFFLDNRYTDY